MRRRSLTPPHPCRRAKCAGPGCWSYLAPVAGSLVHGVEACAAAVIEANHLLGLPEMSREEVGAYLGVSRSRVQQIEEKALEKARKVAA